MTERHSEADRRLEAELERLREIPERDPKHVVRGRRLFLLEARAIRGELPTPLLQRLRNWISGYLSQEILFLNERPASLAALVTMAMVATVLFGTLAATAYASQRALPGESLYSMKIGLERAQLALSRDAGRETRLQLAFADERLDELVFVIERGRTEPTSTYSNLVEQFESHIETAFEKLGEAADGDPLEAKELAAEVMEALSQYSKTLSELNAIVPDAVRPAIGKALELSRPVSHLAEVDLFGTVVSIVDPDPQTGVAFWEIDLGNGIGIVSVIVTEQTFIADGVAVGESVTVQAFIVDDTFVAVDFILQDPDDDSGQ